jgi:hypothetical protein
MPRRKMPPETEGAVLVLSRRRCCICYGLNRDIAIMSGQIAHLDGRPDSNDLDNLAFLCFEHHDQYDSSTSQSKGLTPREVRQFRMDLHEIIDSIWSKPVRIGETEARQSWDVSGRYVRDGEFSSAEIQVWVLINGNIRVTGLALWGKTKEYGPNLGEVDFETDLKDSKVVFKDTSVGGEEYCLEIEFKGARLIAMEKYVVGYFGMNVSFEGEYRRVN